MHFPVLSDPAKCFGGASPGDATVFCDRKSYPQQAPLKQGSEHELLQAIDASHASLSHQVLAPLFLAADCVQACLITAHAVWHHSSWVGSIYWDVSLGIQHLYLLSSLAD